MTLPAPLQLLQRLLREHASANALPRKQQTVLQEGLRIIQARKAAVETFMRELLLVSGVDLEGKPRQKTRLIQWILRLVADDRFRDWRPRANEGSAEKGTRNVIAPTKQAGEVGRSCQ